MAAIYGYEVKRLNEQVKCNINRFPDDFMFRLTKDELEFVKSQIATSPMNNMFSGQGGGTRKLPYAFTEQGIYMLATVLRGEIADQQSIFIMRAFRELRHFVYDNMQFITKNEMQLLTNYVLNISEQNMILRDKQQKIETEIKNIYETIEQISDNFILPTDLKNFVIYKNQKFEADVAYTEIYRKAKKSIYIIDDYVDIKTLNLLRYKESSVEVILFTKNKGNRKMRLSSSEIDDFNAEYAGLSIRDNNECHDRFIVIDYKSDWEKVYHCGASSKDAGNKVCAINEFEETSLLYPVIDKMLSE